MCDDSSIFSEGFILFVARGVASLSTSDSAHLQLFSFPLIPQNIIFSYARWTTSRCRDRLIRQSAFQKDSWGISSTTSLCPMLPFLYYFIVISPLRSPDLAQRRGRRETAMDSPFASFTASECRLIPIFSPDTGCTKSSSSERTARRDTVVLNPLHCSSIPDYDPPFRSMCT